MKIYLPFLISMAATVVDGANNDEETHHRRTRIRRTRTSTVVIDETASSSNSNAATAVRQSSDFGEIQEEELERILTTMSMSMDMSMPSSSTSPEPPICVGDHCPKCDGTCAGEYPYGCAWWFMDDKVKYQCQPNGGTGCAYLAEDEEPMEGWCTYWEHHGAPEVEDECDNVCAGEYPYGCAWWDMDDVVAYQCQPTPSGSSNNFVGGCAYLEEGETGHAGWCTYKTA